VREREREREKRERERENEREEIIGWVTLIPLALLLEARGTTESVIQANTVHSL
jgi:hypothetical protein